MAQRLYFFLKILFIYSRETLKERERERERERQRHRQREKQASHREPDVGLNPGIPRIMPCAKGRHSTAEPRRRPYYHSILKQNPLRTAYDQEKVIASEFTLPD